MINIDKERMRSKKNQRDQQLNLKKKDSHLGYEFWPDLEVIFEMPEWSRQQWKYLSVINNYN